jgi:heat shock protein HslJ
MASMRESGMSTIALFLLAFLASCTTASVVTGPTLTDSQWRFTAIDGKPPIGEATLSFQRDRLSVSAGCNRMTGTWRSESGRLITGPLAATRMFCEGRMEQESVVSDLLGASPQLTVHGDHMRLKSAGHWAGLERKRQISPLQPTH